MEKIDIYTDGSCLGNPGPGGWAFIVHYNSQTYSVAGSEKDTTNNRMEMTAIREALRWLHNMAAKSRQRTAKAGPKSERSEQPIKQLRLNDDLSNYKITIHSDSNLLIQTFNQGWKRKANTDLWAEIDKLRGWLNIEWKWVKAHATNKYNNEVDKLAFNAASRAQKS